MSQTDKLLNYFTNRALSKAKVIKFNLVDMPEVKTLQGDGSAQAYSLYAKHYTTLRKSSGPIAPQSVQVLTNAVKHAQLAIVLWQMSKDNNTTTHDQAATLNVLTFKAGNWLRRFVYERRKVDVWFDEEEMKEAGFLSEKLRSEADSLISFLIAQEPSLDVFAKQNQTKWASEQHNQGAKTTEASAHHQRELALALSKAERILKALRFYVRELQDATNLSPEQEALISHARGLLQSTQLELHVPPWRNQGIPSLGPWGVGEIVDAKKTPIRFLQANFKDMYPGLSPKQLQDKLGQTVKRSGTYTLIPDHDICKKYAKYMQPDGRIQGSTSPYAYISIPKTDPTFKLIRIPPKATYFCWANPLIDSKKELDLDSVNNATEIDLFLLLGGFVYFDAKLEQIQCNALVPQGSQLQFSSPVELPEDICQALESQNRFHEITLDGLGHATHFAWILPGEFCESSWRTPFSYPYPGAFAYKYPDAKTNNYFVLAAVDSSLGNQIASETVTMH